MAVGSLVLPALLVVMGLFFLVSGVVVTPSVDRRGPGGFARHRLLRLGLPYVVWVLLLWPAVVWAPRRAAGWTATYGEMFLGAEPFLDPGAMWFVGVLLLYSLVYAAWRAWRSRAGDRFPGVTAVGTTTPRGSASGGSTAASTVAPARGPEIRGRDLVLLAAGVSVTTVLVRFVFPFDSHQVAEVQLWQWPQYVALFGLGVVAGRRGALQPVPARLRRGCGRAALGALAVYAVLFGVVVAQGLDPLEELTRPMPAGAPLLLALLEGPLAVPAAVWALGTAQHRLAGPLSPLGRSLARSAYAAYLLQGVVLVGLALALRPLPAVAEVKALVVAVGGVVGSFALGWLLVRRTPVGRVL